MNACLRISLVLGFSLGISLSALSAKAQYPQIFGLQSIQITPASGTATFDDPITIQLGGTSGTTLIPQEAVITWIGANVLEIVLRTTGSIGATIPTPWSRQASIFPTPTPPGFGPLSPGVYDFYVRGVTGFGTGSEHVLGVELAINDYVVIPEPGTGGLAAIAIAGLSVLRQTSARRRRGE